MFPSNPGGGDRSLEDRLRGLILSNANANPVSNNGQQPPVVSPVTPRLPPHMLMATPAQKEEYLAKVTPGAKSQSPSTKPSQPSPRQKRPNQAQRRQMSSQVAVPIETRPDQFVQGFGQDMGSFNGHPPSMPFQLHSNQQGYQNQRHTYHQQQQQQQHSHQYQRGGGHPLSPQQMPIPTGSSQTSHYQPRASPHYRPRQGPTSPQQQQQKASYGSRPPPRNRQLFQPSFSNGQGRGRSFRPNSEELTTQCAYLENLIQERIPTVGIDAKEENEKETFRLAIEKICQEAISVFEQQELGNEKFDASTVELQCFGSMKSGFATRASDMDLALLTPNSEPAPDSPESRIPRLLEKRLLSLGYGARLLTRTRVPIIKLCQYPPQKLLSDLLQERLKWDNGGISEADDKEGEAADTDTGNTTAIKTEDEKNGAEKSEAERSEASKNDEGLGTPIPSHVPAQNPEELYASRLSSLKQTGTQSLRDYHNSAKQLLRKLGSRDIYADNYDLNDKEAKILNDVCRAFVIGLASESLSTQLRQCDSIRTLFDSKLLFMQRSLNGVWTQVEGALLALAWEVRHIKEFDEQSEIEASATVEQWREMQQNIGAYTDPVFYNKQLVTASDKLKRISSLQLELLKQLPREEPNFYLARMERILIGIKGREIQSLPDSATPIIVAKYVAGINSARIRTLLASGYDGATLREIAHEHQRIQLAHDYEHALRIGLFEEKYVASVEKYIDYISKHKVKELREDTLHFALTVQIQGLPDPTQISLLKPHDRYKDHLEFPKTDIGIQCDINFSAHLAIHNTQLLRCYSFSDPRVKPMILFVKYWAKVRGINTPYRGTLSSYGYVLMVLHYLVNIAQPFVCPNLQLINKDPPPSLPPAEIEVRTICEGRDVRFWRNEKEIKDLADRKMLNHNHDTLGLLLRGFFEYFAQNGLMSTVPGRTFDWGRGVLSLKTPGGLLTKQEKGWVGAKTVVETKTIAAPLMPKKAKAKDRLSKDTASIDDGSADKASPAAGTGPTEEVKVVQPIKTIEETKQIRHRYLVAIEDPFELDHNVARTVTHDGIVAIRDEFRRAWKIIRDATKDASEEGLFDPVSTGGESSSTFKSTMHMLHDRWYDRGCGDHVPEGVSDHSA